MKRIIQLCLFILLIVISVFFYQIYFIKEDLLKTNNFATEDQSSLDNKNNLIKNLEYNVILNDNSQYLIKADESELQYIDGIEMVYMREVDAKFFDVDGSVLTITSDKAIFNNSIYDTEFRDNVKVVYLDHVISSNKLDLNFSKNIVIIFDNVIYQGSQGDIISDNIVINLIDKNVEIFMNNAKKNVIVNSK
jgi:hypothetical protein